MYEYSNVYVNEMYMNVTRPTTGEHRVPGKESGSREMRMVYPESGKRTLGTYLCRSSVEGRVIRPAFT